MNCGANKHKRTQTDEYKRQHALEHTQLQQCCVKIPAALQECLIIIINHRLNPGKYVSLAIQCFMCGVVEVNYTAVHQCTAAELFLL